MLIIEHGKVYIILLLLKKNLNYLILTIVQSNHSETDSPRVNIQVNELLLLHSTKVLCLFDTGRNVNLISEYVIKSSEYLSSLPILDC